MNQRVDIVLVTINYRLGILGKYNRLKIIRFLRDIYNYTGLHFYTVTPMIYS